MPARVQPSCSSASTLISKLTGLYSNTCLPPWRCILSAGRAVPHSLYDTNFVSTPGLYAMIWKLSIYYISIFLLLTLKFEKKNPSLTSCQNSINNTWRALNSKALIKNEVPSGTCRDLKANIFLMFVCIHLCWLPITCSTLCLYFHTANQQRAHKWHTLAGLYGNILSDVAFSQPSWTDLCSSNCSTVITWPKWSAI